MNSLRIAGVLSRPYVPSLLKSGAHFSPLISERTWISSLRFCRIPIGTSIVRAVISSTEPSVCPQPYHVVTGSLRVIDHVCGKLYDACTRSHISLNFIEKTDLVTKTQTEKEKETEKVELACPVCFRPLPYSGFESPALLTVKKIKLRCKNCQKSYDIDGGIIDLTLPNEGVIPQGSSFFQNPVVAFIYERGYRDFFGAFGFPGFDEEAEMARKLLEPARGETIIDLSCGPGGFTRRFLVGGEYEAVIAADFSLAMLEQCRGFLQSDASVDLSKVVLVRADAARLPFETGSVAGVHSAAAIHCWPNVLTSVAEISRILRPGGVFVASTFLLPLPGLLNLKSARQTIDQLQLPFNWFSEGDLRATTEACGLVNWYSYRRGIYILFAASKPI